MAGRMMLRYIRFRGTEDIDPDGEAVKESVQRLRRDHDAFPLSPAPPYTVIVEDGKIEEIKRFAAELGLEVASEGTVIC